MRAWTPLLLVGLLLGAAYWFDPPPGLAVEGWRALALLLAGVVLWSTPFLPTPFASFVVVWLMWLTGVADITGALAGYRSQLPIIVMCISLLGVGIRNAGLDVRLMRLLMRLRSDGWLGSLATLALATNLMAPVLPAATGRMTVLEPVVRQIARQKAQPTRFFQAAMLMLASVTPVSSLAFLTGGGLSLTGYQVLKDGGLAITWLQWLVYMLLPTWLIVAAATVVTVWLFQPRAPQTNPAGHPEPDPPLGAPQSHQTSGPPQGSGTERLTGKEGVMLFAVSLVLILWAVGPGWGLPAVVPAIIAVVVVALPPWRLVEQQDLKQAEWSTIFLIGSALGLSQALVETGGAPWLVQQMMAWLPTSAPLLVKLGGLLLLAVPLRLAFVSPVACTALVLPLVITYANHAGLDPLRAALAVLIIIAAALLIPIQAPYTVFSQNVARYPNSYQLRYGMAILPFILLVNLLSYFLWWPFVQHWWAH